jgi:hypothetical protein
MSVVLQVEDREGLRPHADGRTSRPTSASVLARLHARIWSGRGRPGLAVGARAAAGPCRGQCQDRRLLHFPTRIDELLECVAEALGVFLRQIDLVLLPVHAVPDGFGAFGLVKIINEHNLLRHGFLPRKINKVQSINPENRYR